MVIGVVLWFNDKRGFGLIKATSSFQDLVVFVYYDKIISSYAHKSLKQNDNVSFDVYLHSRHGFEAHNVKVID